MRPKAIKVVKVEQQTELSHEQITRNGVLLNRFSGDLNAFADLVAKKDIAITGYMLTISYTHLDNTDTGAFGCSGNVEKVLKITDAGLLEIDKQKIRDKRDRLLSGGKIH